MTCSQNVASAIDLAIAALKPFAEFAVPDEWSKFPSIALCDIVDREGRNSSVYVSDVLNARSAVALLETIKKGQ